MAIFKKHCSADFESHVQPYEFVAGTKLGDNGPRNVGDSAGGLFSGVGGPKPPPALSTAVIGMKDGGKVGSVPDSVSQAVFLIPQAVYVDMRIFGKKGLFDPLFAVPDALKIMIFSGKSDCTILEP